MADCRWCLSAGLLLLQLLMGCAGGEPGTDVIPAARLPVGLQWLAATVDPVPALTLQPVACDDPAGSPQAVLGRLAFESPALLGGQAARMGLSCAACHPSARRHAGFQVPGISGAPGTADVTGNFFSSTGGDGQFQPVPIPDLAQRHSTSIPDRTSAAFRQKLVQLVTVEFDGQYPSDEVLDALQRYLLGVDSRFCQDGNATTARSWQQDWQRLQEAVGQLDLALARQQPELAKFLVRVTRQRLEVLYQQFGLQPEPTLDQELLKASASLAALMDTSSRQRRQQLAVWQQQLQGLPLLLEQLAPSSAYNPDALRRVLATQAARPGVLP